MHLPVLSLGSKRRIKGYLWTVRRPTGRLRTLPDFIVFGAQKAGTTSLFRYLMSHHQVLKPFGQEPTFFSHETKWSQGINEYRAQFPFRSKRRRAENFITGEASGEYLYYPSAPERILTILPNVKLISVLRHPVERTISHYFHNVKLGIEARPIEAAIEDELAWQSDPNVYNEPEHRKFGPWGGSKSYIGRSLYARHLERWLGEFPSENLLILEAEAMFENPASTMRKVCEFLGIDPTDANTEFGTFNAGSKSSISGSVLEGLTADFAIPNRNLAVLLSERRDLLHPLSESPRWCSLG